jgi:MFS family permease
MLTSEKNWSTLRKSINFGLACTFVLFTFVQMCNIYVAYGPYAQDLGITYNDYNSAIASSYAGLTVGCLFFMPFVHRYGRRPVYLVSSAIQFATTVWAAKMNTKGELIATNFLAAIGGAVSEAIVLITIADLFFVHQRARMNGIYGMMQSIGSFLGPVSMGYVVKSLGWRFMWWLTTIFVGVNFVAVIFLFEESKYIAHSIGQPINQQETGVSLDTSESRSSIDKTPGSNLRSVDEAAAPSYVKKTYRQRMALFTPASEPFIQHFYQPFVIFFTIPAIAYTAITYGMLLAFMATTTSCLSYFTLLPPYNFSPDKVGLLSLGPFVGLLLSTIVIAPLSDWSVVWLAKRNKGVYEPEMRLWLAIPGSLIAFAGLMTFGFCLSQVSSTEFPTSINYGSPVWKTNRGVLGKTCDGACCGLCDILRWLHGLCRCVADIHIRRLSGRKAPSVC